MDVIESFIKKYEKEYDFYSKLTKLAGDLLEREVFNRGIKAIVTHRTKKIDSLREKLYKRNLKKQYLHFEEIQKDIVDLTGLRVALYFPSDRKILNQCIEEIFEVKVKKEFPADTHHPQLNKRFSGYWATHYRGCLKKETGVEERFTSHRVEIQAASVLMHAWSEVEHDLVYKPLSGDVSEEEQSILDEINGLVIAGEIALERLQKAYASRTRKKKEITDRYELSMLVINNFKNLDASQANLGNTSLLNNYLQVVSKMNTEEIVKSFETINLKFAESVTDQILYQIIAQDYDQNIHKYLSSFTDDKIAVEKYHLFIRAWILLEKLVLEINKKQNGSITENLLTDLPTLSHRMGFTEDEILELKDLRVLRNKILHGYTAMSISELEASAQKLNHIIYKTLKKIKEKAKKEIYANELNNLEIAWK